MSDAPMINSKPLKDYYRETEHELTEYKGDWSKRVRIKRKWWRDCKLKKIERIDESFYEKRKLFWKMSNINHITDSQSVEKR